MNAPRDLQGCVERFVDACADGDIILESIDGEAMAPWRHLLPRTLAARGLKAVPIEGVNGFVVRSSYPHSVFVGFPSPWAWMPLCRGTVRG